MSRNPFFNLSKRTQMRVFPALASCVFTLLAGLSHAQGLADPPGTLRAEDNAAAAVSPLGNVRERSATLRELGIDYEITLRGTQGNIGVPFSVRTDEIVNEATLHLKYSYSPALLPDLSHIKVTVNGVTVGTLPIVAGAGGRALTATLQIDPRVVSDYNHINLQLIGHYARTDEQPDHSSLWANIDSASTLSLVTAPVALANDLALLPLPFFDVHDIRPLELPFFFSQSPDLETLQAAGIVSSWFGTQAGYRGAVFPVSTTALPDSGNAVVFATPQSLPDELATAGGAMSDIDGPTLAVMTHPDDANGKLLLVLGRDAGELRQAAIALALRVPLSGAVARIGELTEPVPRAPYDAPHWISSSRPVMFGDLVSQPQQLNVSSYSPDLIRVGLQLPPDLFVWGRKGIPVNLKYRYTVPESDNKSALNISINETFVTALPLNGRPYAETLPVRWWNSLGARGAMPVEQRLTLPTGPFSANSQLRFHFSFDRPAQEHGNADVSAAIDADSSIDLSSFDHYMAMPNLAAFSNAGYPFTRMADLSESTVVLPNAPNEQDFSNVLTLLGRFGSSTGYPALRVSLALPGDVARHADSDLLVLGSTESQPLYTTWRKQMPVDQGSGTRRFVLSDWLLARLPGFLTSATRRTDLQTTAEVSLQAQPDDVLMMGFESPLKSGRSVVAFVADDASNMSRMFEAWFEPGLLKAFQGSVVLLQDKKVTSLAGNQTYYTGHLPLPTWLRWYFAHHPLWLAVTVLLTCLLLAAAARVLLRLHSIYRRREGRQ